jgi:predicted metal-dependent peptidase
MVTLDEYWQIARLLQNHFELFYTCWHLGKPDLTDELPTAGVLFDKHDGRYLHFMFNEEWYNELTDYERAFIISHECLHVILNHGKRFRGLVPEIANIAADIVINHMLTTKFGFDKSKLQNKIIKVGAWFETVFPKDKCPPRGMSFEYYYELLLKEAKAQQNGKGNGTNLGVGQIDDHSGLEQATADNVLEALKEMAQTGLTNKEKDVLKQLGKVYGDKNDECKKAGVDPGTIKAILEAVYNPKMVWEKIIKSMRTAFRQREKEKDTWISKHRRHHLLSDELILPCSREVDSRDYNKLELVAFMDISGSCIHLKDDFYNLLNTVPTDLFNITAHTFDTAVREIDLKKTKITGGGGTSFSVIEQYIRKNFKRYPYAVLIITDGAGDNVSPQHPDRWHWVLSDNYKQLIPKESKIFELKDFKR